MGGSQGRGRGPFWREQRQRMAEGKSWRSTATLQHSKRRPPPHIRRQQRIDQGLPVGDDQQEGAPLPEEAAPGGSSSSGQPAAKAWPPPPPPAPRRDRRRSPSPRLVLRSVDRSPAVTFPTSMHGLDPPRSPGPGPLQTQPLRLRSPPGAGGNACVEKLRTLPRVCTRLVKQQATSSGPPRLGISSLQSSHLRGIRFARS